MGILITVKNANFSENAVGFLAPVPLGLEYWNYFGDKTERTGRNMAADKDKAAVTGEPVIGDGFCTFESAVHFVQTTISDQKTVTLLCVARSPFLDSRTAFLIGNYSSNDSGGVGSNLFFQNGTVHCAAERSKDGAGSEPVFASFMPPTLESWSFYVARISDTRQVVEDRTRSLKFAEAFDEPRVVVTKHSYRIGSGWSRLQGPVDIALAAIYSRELADSEVETIYMRSKAYLATKKIRI